jgi:quercetin dioxygenase-like cupin family protein
VPEDAYFARAADPDGAARPGAWFALLDHPGAEIAPGIVSRPIAGESAMLTYVVWERDGVAPLHSHVEEQLVLLIEGEVELTIGNVSRVMSPGDVAVIPAFATHGGRGRAQRSVAVEAFAPPRTHLLELAGPIAPK